MKTVAEVSGVSRSNLIDRMRERQTDWPAAAARRPSRGRD